MADVEFKLWLEFEIAQGFDPEDDFCNIKITLSNGEVYTLNIWTYRFLDTARQQDRASGDNLQGGYLVAPDLFVERLERGLLERVVADLLRTGGLKAQWRVPDDTPIQETASAK